MSGAQSTTGANGLRAYGHYEVRRLPDGSPWLLGAGGMGLTYRATDTRLQLDVALKIIHPARAQDADAQRLFLREARAAARVIHANVAPVLFLSDEPGRIFYAMEFVDGVSLHAWLRQHGPPPVGQALAFAGQIAAGLSAIHAQHLVHRDLKPGNVMVMHFPASDPRSRALAASGGCVLKIIDFGLARGTGGMPSDPGAPDPTLGFRGSVAYASPEQCEEVADLDGRSDLYALGCILWEMLTGKPPFVGVTHRELLNQQVGAKPPWPQLAHLPEPILEVLRRLLAKDRRQRFADATTAAEALLEAQYATGLPPAATAATRLAETVRLAGSARRESGRRSRLRWILAAGLAASLALAAAVWWSRIPRVPAEARRLPDAVPTSALSAEAAARRRFIAVLPFVNRGGDSANDFFTEGIHEDVLASLAKVRDLRVIARSSVVKYRDDGTGVDVRRIGRELGVGTVLQGSVRRQGSRVRVVTQLVDASTDEQLWSDSFDREVTDVFEIQSAVAREIAGALAANFTTREKAAVARVPTRNPAAYELFLQARARHARSTVTREWLDPVVELYERATTLDPDFALAYAMLARVHGEIYWFAVDSSPSRIERARAAAQRAVKLQPGLAEAHVALGEIHYRAERNYEAALAEFQIALAISPSNSFALESSALALRRLNRWQESLTNLQQSAAIAPDDGQKHMALAEMYFVMRRFAEAEPCYRRSVELSANAEWEFNLELCRFELNGDVAEFTRRANVLIPRLAPDSRATVQSIVRDFRGAMETLTRPGADPEIRDVLVSVPRALFVGRLQRHLRNPQAAAAAFSEAVEALAPRAEAAPDNPQLRMKLASALAGRFDREAALREGEAALALVPESRDPLIARWLQLEFAQVCASVGEADRACELLERLLTVEIKLTRLHLRHFPDYDLLRGFPRFERLIASRNP